MNKKRIVFTGGGSAGHVTPNLALIEALRNQNWEISYIGSARGIEREIIEKQDIPYYSIATGKLRRYFSWQNFIDPFKMLLGIWQASRLCRKLKPDIIFSKGGFVAVPVVIAAWLRKIPVIAHESDLTPGLANRLSYYFAKKVCITFAEGKQYFPHAERIVITGTPVRRDLFLGCADKGRALCHFNRDKPVILIMGGGLGAAPINRAVESALDELLARYQIIHICGKEQSHDHSPRPGYYRFGYVHEPLADLLACTDIVVSRAGSNSIWELLALEKPHLLIPLSRKASRGDQLLNADYFAKHGWSRVLQEDELTSQSLLSELRHLEEQFTHYKQKLAQHGFANATQQILTEIYALAL